MSNAQDEVLDVAIVGGGVSGAYTAWRLLCDRGDAAGPPPKLAIFEGSDRIGGRLLSVKPPGMERLVCELGGMYFSTVHPMVCSLSARLGLDVQSIPHVTFDTLYVRRQRFGQDHAKVPYNFSAEERAVAPDDLMTWALERLLPGITKLQGKALDVALEKAVVEGLPLSDWGFWNLLCLVLSSEGFAYVHDSTPDDYMLINSNAVDAIRGMQIFCVPGIKVFHLANGYATLPTTLAAKVEEAGGAVHMRHRLKSFERLENGLIRLHLARESEGWGPSGGGEPITVLARSLVLALPQRSLELLEQSGPLFEDAKTQEMLASVIPIPMVKIFSCYSSPWWKELGFNANGSSLTDMPLKVCLYWGTEGDTPGGDPANTNSLLLTSLEDMSTASFWAGLRDSHRSLSFAPKAPKAVPARQEGDPAWKLYADRTTDRIVRETQRQLAELHGVEIPEPYAAASADWSVDPYGGALCMWKIGVRSAALVTEIIRPVAGLPVYVCGESYSRSQGWVEGALETSELLLESHFGLRRPSWLKETSDT